MIDLDALLADREGPCVSIYMPTHRTGREVQQDPIRLKNLLRRAEQELKGVAARSGSASDVLEPARALLQESAFWEHASDGLAVFLAPGFSRTIRLPATFEERVVVSGAFHVKPLLPLVSGDGRFYVLAISQNRVRLLQGTRFSVGELETTGLPRSLKEALWIDDYERTLQYHSGTSTAPGRRSAMYHGQGGPADVERTNLLRYFRRVDEALGEYLGTEFAPVVLAGVERYLPMYREVSKHWFVVDEGIRGNPDELTARELHLRAWQIVEPIFRKDQEEALARYRERAGSGRTSRQVEEIVPAAHHGRVESLFVALGEQCWGAYIPDGGGSVILHDRHEQGDRDLLDIAAAATLRTGGRVYVLPRDAVPAKSAPLAAVFRY